MSAAVALAPAPSRRALLPLLREIGDLKRITSAGRRGSIAERAFRRAWAELVAGGKPEAVAFATTARCLAAARLADLDVDKLRELGLDEAESREVLRAALAEFADVLPAALPERLASTLEAPHAEVRAEGEPRSTQDRGASFEAGLRPAPQDEERGSRADPLVPPFVEALAAQPRAGVTCPGRPRIVLLPAESHAEHCLVVAVYAVLLGEPGSDPGTVFLAALAHHLHNAAMPDAGYTGETLLGDHLAPVMERSTTAALAELAEPLRTRVASARTILPDAGTPEGRAFHSADVLDRVLEIDQHLAAARLTMSDVLGEMALVHDGPVKPFHDGVLVEFGLP